MHGLPIRSPRRRVLVLIALAVASAVGISLALALSSSDASGTSNAIRQAAGRYLGEPALIYPICMSRTEAGYAKAAVYPIPVRYTLPFRAILHRGRSGWTVVAWWDEPSTGWLAIPPHDVPRSVTRERWCNPLPLSPRAARSVIAKGLASVSTFGMHFPYVPVDGPPLYKPSSLGYSTDGGEIYYVTRWLSYGKESARANATWDYNPCDPSCATNKHYTHVIFTIALTNPKPCLDVTAYRTLTITRSSNAKLLPNTSRSLDAFCQWQR